MGCCWLTGKGLGRVSCGVSQSNLVEILEEIYKEERGEWWGGVVGVERVIVLESEVPPSVEVFGC